MTKCRTLSTMSVLLVVFAIQGIVCPPVDPGQKHKPNTEEEAKQEEDLGLEYGKYLQQVVQILEQDKDFAKKLENVSTDDIKSGKVATQLEFVNHNVRSKLDELKRIELDRLRMLARQEYEHNELGVYRDGKTNLQFPADKRRWRSLPKAPSGDGINRAALGRDLNHVDIDNPHTFEVEDLRKLIKTASSDLDKLNEKRKEEFKQYEMEKEHQYREDLKHMSEEERKAAEAKHLEAQKRHKEHPKIHHPGSKPQLEQVWEEQDNLPKEEFNPSTFFAMHDVNGDGYWDEEEVEAILSLEIKKMYEANNSDDDPVEMMEEYHRMREHIYNETDTNRDGLISKAEFMDMTKKAEFNQDEGWKGLDEERVYTDEELANYEEHLRQLAMAQNMQFPAGVVPPYYHPEMGAGYHPAVDGQHNQPPQGQFQHPPQGQFQHNQPPQGQFQHNQPPQGQFQHNQPPQGQFQHNQPPQGQFQHNQPPQGQFQHNQPPQGQFQHNQPPQGQFQHNQPPQGQFQHNQPPQGQFQHNQPPQGQFEHHGAGQQQPQVGYQQHQGQGGQIPQSPPQYQQPNQQQQQQQHGQQMGQNQQPNKYQQGQLPPQGGQLNQQGNQYQQPNQFQPPAPASPQQGQLPPSGVPQNVPSQAQAGSVPPVAAAEPQVPVQNQPSSQQAASQKPTGQ